MTRGQDHYLGNIIEDAYVAVVASTNTAMMEYPYILGHPDECSPTLSKMADEYIMDSKITDTSVGNDDVLRRASDIDADVVTPADVMNDPETTTDRIVDLLVQLDDMEYDPTVMVPLQPSPEGEAATHVDHYHDVRDALADHGFDITDYRLSVGGIKEWSVTDQLEAIINVRRVAGDDAFIHGLGFGTSNDWIVTMRRYPELLDSIDMTSVSRDVVQSGKLFTPQLDRVDYRLPRGKNSTVLTVLAREFVLYTISYLLGPHAREEDVPSEIQREEVRTLLRAYDQTTSGTAQQPANAD